MSSTKSAFASLLTFALLLMGCATGDPNATTQPKPSTEGFSLPRVSSQVLLGITEGWNNSYVSLQSFERNDNQWVPTSEVWKGRLGRNGSSWGIGLHPSQPGKQKVEGDGRTPAGVFSIGGVWGYAPKCQKHPNTPYRQITSRDLWVEDRASSKYNQHIILNRDPSSQWEKDAQMRQGDYAHSLKLFIAHNAPPKAISGKGSAIFFHIWRGGGSKATAGCTTMKEEKLRSLISNVDPTKNPTYVILPRTEYNRLKGIWQLP